MELERRGSGGDSAPGQARGGKAERSQVELATISVTSEEITEEGEDDGSVWSARKNRQQDAGPHTDDDDHDQHGGEAFRNGLGESPPQRLTLKNLTLASMVAAGIQFGWALQLSLLTPYVQTLGIDHALASFIWLCGPITGLVVQPCIGIWSDNCKSRFGRRRPYIVIGALMVVASVTVIGFSADLGYVLGDTKESCLTYTGFRAKAATVFVVGFWLLDLANNTVQGPARALVADLAGPDQRDSANAIFCLWMALGNILGFSTGASGQWHRWFPFLKSTACCEACANLKAAFLVSVLFLTVCTTVTLIYADEIPLTVLEHVAETSEKQKKRVEDEAPFLVQQQQLEGGMKEGPIMIPVEAQQAQQQQQNGTVVMRGADRDGHRDSVENGYHSHHKDEKKVHSSMGPGAVMMSILLGVRKLPQAMRVVLVVMALCWVSWFPFFLFDTDWMGREVYRGDPTGGPTKDLGVKAAYDNGVRAGAFGLLLNSVVLAIGSFLIDPMCSRFGSKYVWGFSNFMVFICMACTAIVTALAGDHHTVNGQNVYVHTTLVKVGAIALFTILGFPLAITYSVPYALTAELIADSGGGQGLAMGILNLAVVIPQMAVALLAGPWDALFGGGNQPAFMLAAVFAFSAGVISVKYLPRLSRHGYQRAGMHGFG